MGVGGEWELRVELDDRDLQAHGEDDTPPPNARPCPAGTPPAPFSKFRRIVMLIVTIGRNLAMCGQAAPNFWQMLTVTVTIRRDLMGWGGRRVCGVRLICRGRP